jgi:Winged helix DNA-binding domain
VTAAEGETLSARRLNRALLARQHLLEPSNKPLAEVIEDIGGLQTQYAPSGYYSLFTRMASFDRADLTRAMEAREVIHGTLMRVTIHSVTARDYWPMSIGVREARRAWLDQVTARTRDVARRDAAVEAAREILADGPMKLRDIVRAMAARGFDPIPQGALSVWLDVVRAPPSGTWEHRANDIYALAEHYLAPADVHPEGMPTEESGLRLLLYRYLHGFGPARPVDFSDWAGVSPSKVTPVIDTTELRRFRDEQGRLLIDLPDAPIPDEDTPAPVRFLPQFDPTLLVNCRRTQILPEAYRPLVFNTRTPWSTGTFIVDGRVAGTWRYDLGAVVTESFAALPGEIRREVEAEAARLERFVNTESLVPRRSRS